MSDAWHFSKFLPKHCWFIAWPKTGGVRAGRRGTCWCTRVSPRLVSTSPHSSSLGRIRQTLLITSSSGHQPYHLEQYVRNSCQISTSFSLGKLRLKVVPSTVEFKNASIDGYSGLYLTWDIEQYSITGHVNIRCKNNGKCPYDSFPSTLSNTQLKPKAHKYGICPVLHN